MILRSVLLLGLLFAEKHAESYSGGNLGSIEGRVNEEATGKALAGSTVFVAGVWRGTTTDSAGAFRIDSLPAQEKGLSPQSDTVLFATARKIGYFPETRQVLLRVGKVEHVDFRMRRDPRPIY